MKTYPCNVTSKNKRTIFTHPINFTGPLIDTNLRGPLIDKSLRDFVTKISYGQQYTETPLPYRKVYVGVNTNTNTNDL